MIYDINLNPITDESKIDLSVGMIIKKPAVKAEAMDKTEYGPEDIEELDVYVVDEHKKLRKERANIPTDIDRLEARLAYVEMMTGLLEV